VAGTQADTHRDPNHTITIVGGFRVMVSNVGLISEVNQHRARLVLGWVTVFGQVNHPGV